MKKLNFSLLGFFMLVTVVCIAAGYYQFREKALKPNLNITPEDVAWATDAKIWKFDLADAGEFYGLSIVTITAGDATTKKRHGRLGGYDQFNIADCRLLTVSMTKGNNVSHMKINWGGGGMSFDIEDFFESGRRSYARNPPVLDGDLIYLASDSQTVGRGSKPFEDDANVIAVEILREPTP